MVKLETILSISSLIMGIAGISISAIALSRLNDASSQPNGLSRFDDFVGTWEATGSTVVLEGPYNASAEEIQTTLTGGSLTYVITVVDERGRFEGVRCPSTISENTGAPAPMGGVIDSSMTEALGTIWFSNSANAPTPSNRWGTWRWLFHDHVSATLFLTNSVNLPTQNARSFVGSSKSKRTSGATTCPTP